VACWVDLSPCSIPAACNLTGGQAQLQHVRSTCNTNSSNLCREPSDAGLSNLGSSVSSNAGFGRRQYDQGSLERHDSKKYSSSSPYVSEDLLSTHLAQ
jgi:hypothetical protein